ncbi:nitroreductase family protein [Olivibacter domesticus]|uniref:Nitroreductase n=1 Tax=Olivibacter domesticus TaxID=407022 RepID=A0A1H7GW78_OLID1|nr:nitroreductase family protein [Olivibacter domesticus]SEK42341.1 Nitroreductase [Olivibacter domesticus]
MELINHLKWRYATKKYNTEKVSEEKVNQILEAINLTASSCGIQPYRVLVISNPEIRAQLGAGSFNGQIVNSSHLLVFAAFNEISITYIEEYIKMAEKQRNLPEGGMDEFSKKLTGYFSANTQEANAIWANKQAYIGLGTALAAAAELKIDTTPMEGFDAQQFDEILGLKAKGLHAVVLLSLGYRDTENDYFANLAKVRLPIEEFSAFVG